MLKTIDKYHIKATAKAIRKAQKKGKIQKIEESELEAITKHLNGYDLLCVIPDRRVGLYYTFLENQKEFVFKVLAEDFKERISESYSKRNWRRGVAAFEQLIAYYSSSTVYIGDSKEQRDIFLKKIHAKEDPDLVSRISSTKKFEGQVLGIVDDETDYKVITQTDDAYAIITLTPNTLEEKASEFYPIPTKRDKIRSLPYKIAVGFGSLTVLLSPCLLMLLGAEEEIVSALRMPSVAIAIGVGISIPFIGSREYEIKKAQMIQFNNELFRYARID